MAKKKNSEGEIPSEIMKGILPLVKKLREIKDKRQELDAQSKKLGEQEQYLEQMLLPKLTGEGLNLVRTKYGTVSVSEAVEYPSVAPADWPKLYDWIFKHKRFELLPHSIKSKPWKEAKDQGETIPFVKTYKEDVLHFRRTGNKAE